MEKEKEVVAEVVVVKMSPELHKLLLVEVEKLSTTPSAIITPLIAEHLKHPELGKVPRKKIGRPKLDNGNGKVSA